jgi:hypothetical protein
MNESRRFDFQQPHSMFGTWLGVVLLFVVFGLFVWVVFGAIAHGDSYEEKRAKARMEKLEQLHKDSAAALTSYAWVDKNKGVVRIPVERAMELALPDLAVKKPVAAYAIATPAPEAAAAPAGATAPSPPPGGQPELRTNPTPKPISVEGPKSEIRGQPAGAANPASAPPGTQPGASATPAASPSSGAAQPNPGGQPLPTPVQSPPGTPLPVRGKSPSP